MYPILAKFQGLTVYSYGLCVALAVALVLVFSIRQAPRNYLSPNTAADLVFILFLAGVVGARIFYVLQHWDDFRSRGFSAFWIAEGGLVWYGGFIFAALTGRFYCRQHRLPLLKWADFFVPFLSLAHGIGRIGCFLNGCCYGHATNSFFSVRFPQEMVQRHPVQLYEALGLFIVAGVLFWIAAQKKRVGEVAGWYLILYGTLRFVLEFLRGDQRLIYYLTLPQWGSLFLFLFGLGLLKTLRTTAHENKN
jgi:phosphatidylglycerol:prolipoprotein diacylglycerol transferase